MGARIEGMGREGKRCVGGVGIREMVHISVQAELQAQLAAVLRALEVQSAQVMRTMVWNSR